MFTLLKQFLTEWNSGKNQRTKLQQAYLLLIIILSVLAGVSLLFNADFGRLVILLAAWTAAVYVFNGVAWALLDAFVAPIIPKHEKPARKK